MDLKHHARLTLDQAADDLVELSHYIHRNPELAFEEHQASRAVAALLERYGFAVQRGFGGLSTAVRAQTGTGALNIALCAEYDALPEVGHACGHNIIAAAAVGAAIALAPVAEAAELSVSLLGTPAEERGGGKIVLLEAGAFEHVHAALMVHPGPMPYDLAGYPCAAVEQLHVRFTGRPAHAALAPHDGINAADAMTVAQVAVGLLRQQFRDGEQVHGIVVDGGEAANVIPRSTVGEFYLRAPTLAQLHDLRPRVRRCFEAGALATGCQIEIEPLGKPYANMRTDADLAALYRANGDALGRRFAEEPPPIAASSDMGNVSHAVPSLQAMVGLDCLPAMPHDAAFADYTATPAADRAMLDAALMLALTALDAARAPNARERLLVRQPQTATATSKPEEKS